LSLDHIILQVLLVLLCFSKKKLCCFDQSDSTKFAHLKGKNYNFSKSQHKLVQMIDQENWEKVEKMCKLHKSCAKVPVRDEKTNMTALPIHFACRKNPNEQAIISLLKANPKGACSKIKKTEEYPLHIACRYEASYDVIALLVIHFVEAVNLKNVQEQLSLDYVRKSGNEEVARFLEDIME